MVAAFRSTAISACGLGMGLSFWWQPSCDPPGVRIKQLENMHTGTCRWLAHL